MKIGITTRLSISDEGAPINGVPTTYLNIIKEYAYPIIIDSTSNLDLYRNMLLNQLKEVDGIILPGGDKISEVDLFIIEYCYINNIPLLGICLGMQEISYYFDNKSITPIGNNSHFDMDKQYLHEIQIVNNSYFQSLLKQDTISVNSRHKYHIFPNTHFTIQATCNDTIEAIKINNTYHMIGVQFHPEIMWNYDNNAKLLFEDFFNKIRAK